MTIPLVEQAVIFRKAAMFIKKGFTKAAFARNAEGKTVDYTRPEACSFCTAGAILKAAYPQDSLRLIAYAGDELKHAGRYRGNRAIALWNDKPERTKEDVVTFLRACARKLQAKAKKAL